MCMYVCIFSIYLYNRNMSLFVSNSPNQYNTHDVHCVQCIIQTVHYTVYTVQCIMDGMYMAYFNITTVICKIYKNRIYFIY